MGDFLTFPWIRFLYILHICRFWKIFISSWRLSKTDMRIWKINHCFFVTFLWQSNYISHINELFNDHLWFLYFFLFFFSIPLLRFHYLHPHIVRYLLKILQHSCYEVYFQLAALSDCVSRLTERQVNSMMRAFQDIPQLQEEIEDTEYTITLVYHAIAENIAKNEKKRWRNQSNLYDPRLVYLA